MTRRYLLPILPAALAFLVVTLVLSIAYAQGVQTSVPPVDLAVASTDTAWSVVANYGPIWGGMLLGYGLASEFLKRNESDHWIAQGRKLAFIVAGVGVLGSVLQAHFGGNSWAGVVLTLIASLKLVISPTAPSSTSTASSSPRTGVTLVTLFALGLGVTVSTSTGCKPYLPPAAGGVVDCINADRSGIDALIASFWPKDGSAPNWSAVEAAAESAGLNVGGCALSEFVQKYLTPAPGNHAPAPSDGWKGHDTLERYREQHANGATFRTKLGDL